VLDPFAGSGSTLLAAELTGRVCYAIELEPGYCELTLSRWEQVTGQSPVCEEG
jgi:DNA modification methylase